MRSNSQKEALKEIQPWTTNNTQIPVEDEMVHLGIRRSNTEPNAAIEDRVKLARKTLYSLGGAGMHGFNGLPIKTSLKIYNAYVIPRALFGMEAIQLTEYAKKKLTNIHKYSLRILLGLPDWTGIPALYLLSGQMPILNQLDVKILTFIQSLLAVGPSRSIIMRQYCIKTRVSHSLINSFVEKLHQYHLPSLLDIYLTRRSRRT